MLVLTPSWSMAMITPIPSITLEMPRRTLLANTGLSAAWLFRRTNQRSGLRSER